MAEVTLFFKKLLAKRKDLSTLESQVLEYMLKYPDRVSEKTIDEFASEIFVSTATVSRTCKKLGFKGYQQLKYALDQYKGTREEIKERQTDDLPSSEIEEHIQRFKKEMNQAMDGLDHKNIFKVVDWLKKSQLVEFFGVGASFPFGSDAARKLTFAGKISSARTDWDELRAVANSMRPTDVAVFLSHSGETLHLIEYAAILKERQVPVVLISGTKGSHLESVADLTLTAYSKSYYCDDIDMSSRFTMNLLIDLIIFEYIKQTTKKE